MARDQQEGISRAKEARAKAKEKEAEHAQRACGAVVLKRLRGEPGSITHHVAESKLTFGKFATAGASENVATAGVLYYEVELLQGRRGGEGGLGRGVRPAVAHHPMPEEPAEE